MKIILLGILFQCLNTLSGSSFDTITKIFGDNGKHARAAVSTNSLPLGVAVEVDAIFELN